MHDELEFRVGSRLSDGMNDDQLEEFEAIIDRNTDSLSGWLRSNSPDFENDPQFKKMESAFPPDIDPLELVAEYAATKWLALNRPDYQAVVRGVSDRLMDELRQWLAVVAEKGP